MKRLKQLVTSLILAFLIGSVLPYHLFDAYAASARISFSDLSVMVGNEVNVTMKVTSADALGGADVTLSYDPNILEFVGGNNANGGAGSIRLLGSMDTSNTTSFSFTLKFKALQAATTNITVSNEEILDVNAQPVTLSKIGQSTIKVTSPASFSKDAALKSLKIDPGTLTPAFSSSITEYTASVDGNTESITVSAGTAHANAKVAVSDTKLQVGDNKIVVKVTAEDGQTVKNYTVNVTKAVPNETAESESGAGETEAAEMSSQTVTIGQSVYTLAASFDESALPAGFEASVYQYKGQEVMAGKGTQSDYILLYLEDAKGSRGFYSYDEKTDSFSATVEVKAQEFSIVTVPLDEGVEVPAGFSKKIIVINNQDVEGWVWSGEKEEQRYGVFYGMNGKGEKDFYRYDKEEMTIQRYFQDPNADTGVTTDQYVLVAEKYNSLLKDYRLRLIVIGILGVLAVVLLVIVILLLKKKKGGPHDDSASRYQNPRKEKRVMEDEYEEEEDFEEGYEEDYDLEDRDIGKNSQDCDSLPPSTLSDRSGRPVKVRIQKEDTQDDFGMMDSLEEMERQFVSRRSPVRSAHDFDEEDDFEAVDLY